MTEFSPDQDRLSDPEALPEGTPDIPELETSEADLPEAEASQGDIFEPGVPPPDVTGPETATEESVAEEGAALASIEEDTVQESDEEIPAEPPNPLAQAFLKLREGRGRETANLYHDIVKPSEPPLAAQMDRGREHDESGRHELAIEEFLAALESDPKNVEALPVGDGLRGVGSLRGGRRRDGKGHAARSGGRPGSGGRSDPRVPEGPVLGGGGATQAHLCGSPVARAGALLPW